MNDFLDLPPRSEKPRRSGLTNIVDPGYGLAYLEDVLSFCHPFIDIYKLGWGSAYISSHLPQKIELLDRHDINACPGGTMFEICYWQRKVPAYADWLAANGFGFVEISNGSLPIPQLEKCRQIEYFANRGFTVLSEVGDKDIRHQSPPEIWIASVKDDLNAGAWKVVMEGRADATAGIYTEDGAIELNIVSRILESNLSADSLIFEAPYKRHMIWFLRTIGMDANLANVPLDEALNLETLRLGLRADTVTDIYGPFGEDSIRNQR